MLITKLRSFRCRFEYSREIQFELADDYTKLEVARLLTYKAAWLIDKAAKHEIPIAVAMTKLWVPHVVYDAINRVLLWYGAYEYIKECPIEIGLRARIRPE